MSKAISTLVLFMAFLLVMPLPVYAEEPAKLASIVDVIRRIIGFLAPAAGIAFLIMLLVGGYQLITSGGDPKAAAQARTTFTYAIIGIVLVVASWLILTVIAGLTGVDVTKVDIPTN